MKNSEQQYKNAFGLGNPPDTEKTKAALNLALDIRKFEISLYWQRTAYFWALIATAFAGYFAILGAEKLLDKQYLAFIVGCIGLIFTWAWYLVNCGSKYWQENWENHVDMLEDSVVGPLYKTVLQRHDKRNFFEKYIFGPQAISVSRVNLAVSIFALFVWIALIVHTLPPLAWHLQISWRHCAIGCITILSMILMRGGSATNLDTHRFKMTRRISQIEQAN